MFILLDFLLFFTYRIQNTHLCKSINKQGEVDIMAAAKKKQTKKEMIQEEASFEEIQKVYKSATRQEIGYLAYKLSQKDGQIYNIEGLDVGDCYINRKGDILISKSSLMDTVFMPGASFTISSSDKTTITLTYDKQITLPVEKTAEEKERLKQLKLQRDLVKAKAYESQQKQG
jgi:hypothetical protein